MLQKILAPVALCAVLAGSGSAVYAQPADASRAGEPKAQVAAENKVETDENDAYRHSAMVKKFGGMLGMNTETAATVFEVLNFAVLAGAIGFAMLKVMPKMFRDRTSAIQKDLVDARTATEEASIRLTGVEDRLSKLDGQIAEMRAQAEKDAAGEEQRMLATVEEEKKRIVLAAEQEIASAALMAQRGLQKYAAELAIDQAARKLAISAETDRLLVQGFARRLAGEDPAGGVN